MALLAARADICRSDACVPNSLVNASDGIGEPPCDAVVKSSLVSEEVAPPVIEELRSSSSESSSSI